MGRARREPAAARAQQTAARVEQRRAAIAALVDAGRVTYSDVLPITARRDELLAAIRDHQVVVVAGETGSGKSTQLPKLCIEAGRGIDGLIGHTQPRRVAARTIAARVAEELGSTLGEEVGYTVRFNDQVGDNTVVRVMTDGILLAELQRDRMLRRYDTIIIDEAHERSLNIDFLLGYLAQLLPQRPDLKVIITSATIDTERFAQHFATEGVPAPVLVVEGRTFPVEIRYLPDEGDEEDDRDQVQRICDGVDELLRHGPGDVLVFVSGEREIHDTADALRRLELRDVEVLPLYARLSSAEQQRIFAPHTNRRVVLSTNVAETSLTVPGVRYVIDAGNARISRYSRRLKVQRLPIVPISQASANQRAGRCGRVAPGVCIRLYGEDDFNNRPAFTEPEILRTNLASVILQMTAIGLGEVRDFPFVEPPEAAAVRDGYALLDELGALEPPQPDTPRTLTPIGRRLARLPVDPRLGRMVLEAERHNCVHDVMVIAAALSIQDPRERPSEKRQVADEFHRRFAVGGSELLSFVSLWTYLREQQRALSSNQFRKLCRAEFLNYLRVREWQDLFSQLRRAVGDIGIRTGSGAGHPDHIHQSILAGLLSHIGMRDRDGRAFRGARGARFRIAPGSPLAKKAPKWVMAAELVETDQLFARRVAAIQPEWAEQVGAHLCSYSYGDPYWDARRGAAVATESATLYGLPIVTGRAIAFDRIDPQGAHEMFVHHALVEGDWKTHHRFVTRNNTFLQRIAAMEARVRRDALFDEDAIETFFAARVPSTVVSTRHFDRWWNRERRANPALLDFTDDLVAEHSGVRFDDYPDTWPHRGSDIALTYRYEPDKPFDGVNVHLPLVLLNQIDDAHFDWQIPGHRYELVDELLRTLPKDVRRDLVPMTETVRDVHALLGEPEGPLIDAVVRALRDARGVRVTARDLHPDRVPAYLRMNFIVVDDADEVIDAGDDLDHIVTRCHRHMRSAIAVAVPVQERTGLTTWDVDAIPVVVRAPHRAGTIIGYPALVDARTSVSLRIFGDEHAQHRAMRNGVRRLLLLAEAPNPRRLAQGLDNNRRLAVAGHTMTFDELVAECISAAADRLLVDAGALPWDRAAFDKLCERARSQLAPIAANALRDATEALHLATIVRVKIDRLTAPSAQLSTADAGAHLQQLVRPGFVTATGTRRLGDVVRYLRGIDYRVDRLAADVARDRRRIDEVRPLERRYARFVMALPADQLTAEIVDIGWQLEEFRLSVFAQALGTKGAASATRIARELDAFGAPRL